MDLKEIRARKNMSQGDVTKQVGITNAFYSQIENGVRKPSVKVAKRIAAVLGFPWERFYEEVS